MRIQAQANPPSEALHPLRGNQLAWGRFLVGVVMPRIHLAKRVRAGNLVRVVGCWDESRNTAYRLFLKG